MAKTISHFFPSFNRWLTALPDSRQQGKVVYDKRFCIWSALAIFLLGLGSRRQYDNETLVAAASKLSSLLDNLNQLAHTQQEDTMHGDAINDYLITLPPKHLEAILPNMCARLIRMRALEYARFFGRYLIVIDATGTGSSHRPCCTSCLRQTQNGKTIYYHLVLEAKLITPQGMVFSIGTEFVENSNPGAKKQDCESAAVPRLMAKIKERFPRLPICMLFDGLYANQSVFALCKKYDWRWIISFKSGRLPTAFHEFMVLKATLCHENFEETHIDGRYQRLSWVHDLEHEGFTFNAFDCLTYNEKGEVVYFAWCTDLPVNRDNVVPFANHGGRKRWTIENQGFNNQKNQEYNLEHAYSKNENARKNFYFILQIAHAFIQLLTHGLIKSAVKETIRSVKNLFRQMADSFRHHTISRQAADPSLLTPIQIRLDSS